MKVMAIVAFLFVATGSGAAYPHYQRTSGTVRCSQCHIAPAGGGLLTQWGQEEGADTLSGGGDGHFLHGAVTLPEWLSIGGDVRAAALANDVGSTEGTELAAFPMQTDIAVAIRSGAWTAVGIVGARGRVRSGDPSSPTSEASEVEEPSLSSYLISREHYVMWRPDESGLEGPYVRAGRFAAPYGLRLADHTAYVRRYLGYNLLEETYGVGGGWMTESTELHATAYVYDPLQGAPRKELGGAVMFEAQPGETLVIGTSARAGVAETTRLQAGLHAKLWLEGSKLLLLGEANGVREMFDGPGDRWQLATYFGPVLMPMPGLSVGIAHQAFAEDLKVRSVLRQGLDAWVSYLPIAHVEVMATGRAQRIGPHERAYVAMLQLHYYL
jgi:hypothetical protein